MMIRGSDKINEKLCGVVGKSNVCRGICTTFNKHNCFGR